MYTTIIYEHEDDWYLLCQMLLPSLKQFSASYIGAELPYIDEVITLLKTQYGPKDWDLRTIIISLGQKFLHKFWSNFIFKISNSYQLQNLNQIWTSRVKLDFKIFTKPSFRISSKIQLHNLYKTLATKYRPNSSFKFHLNLNFKIKSWPNVVLKVWTKV